MSQRRSLSQLLLSPKSSHNRKSLKVMSQARSTTLKRMTLKMVRVAKKSSMLDSKEILPLPDFDLKQTISRLNRMRLMRGRRTRKTF